MSQSSEGKKGELTAIAFEQHINDPQVGQMNWYNTLSPFAMLLSVRIAVNNTKRNRRQTSPLMTSPYIVAAWQFYAQVAAYFRALDMDLNNVWKFCGLQERQVTSNPHGYASGPPLP